MTTPSGRLFGTEAGADLVLRRSYRAPIEDVWASLTESERTARWYGPWEGQAGPGRMIKVQMAFEEGEPWTEMRIGACEPPRRLEISAVDEEGSWFLEFALTESGGVTELRFTQHLNSPKELGMVSHVGPGWEYYLDLFGTARDGARPPAFDDYFPSMRAYYEGLTPE
ncbi:SRPBCC family protein [Nocardia noduli]|uniref:SRPBCC family protein n=1 Tax=Nocardia noduli TaxID=2815722 RepID=UPI001C21CAC2|nr:SRPBCC family protein [Nocardia noduli]